MKLRIVAFQLPVFAIVCCLLLLIAACGNNANSTSGDSTDSSAGNSDQPVVATMPPAQFTAVANQSVTKTMGVTTTEVVTAPASAAQASDADLQRGLLIYTKNKCSGCHGEKGEGVAGKATKTIAGTTLTKEEFDKFLRTGGGQGNDHIFGPSAISPGGMEALRAYVKSLAAQ
ncbi:MAG: c-type cytochrome [Chloroflexi bacterium]|nr:c-type cytochrome [Chloroflexota bacterium]